MKSNLTAVVLLSKRRVV